jgi:phosphoribosylaminoimidazole carboxylase PurE protein
MEAETNPVVSIVLGSDSDLPVMEEAASVLDKFGVPHEIFLTSAHRSPKRTAAFAEGAAGRGIKIIIVGAGMAAHLAGVIASLTSLPVLGVPIDASPLSGMDALFSTVQMPGGIPVATMAIGTAGAKNAALMAVRILSLENEELRSRLDGYIKSLADDVEKRNKKMQESR